MKRLKLNNRPNLFAATNRGPWAQHMEVYRPFFTQTESNGSDLGIAESPKVTHEKTESLHEKNEAEETLENLPRESSDRQEKLPTRGILYMY